MAAFNRVIIVGNLTRDPEYRQLASGQAVCRIGLATNRQFKNRQTGSMVQEVCYIDVDVWGAQAESCRQYLQKGRAVLVEGRLKLDNWEDQNGQSRSKHSIVADRVVFLSSSSQDVTTALGGMTSAHDMGATLSNDPEVFEQVEKARSKVKAIKQARAEKAEASEKSSTGEIDFQDEPPFEDNLPF
jgi:single-strand DNA-binding protein